MHACTCQMIVLIFDLLDVRSDEFPLYLACTETIAGVRCLPGQRTDSELYSIFPGQVREQ